MAATTINRINARLSRPFDALGLAASCLFGIGLVLMAVGLALCLVGVFEPMKLGSLETVLLVVSLGFLGFAAHCMDRADERKRAEWK
jgi:hypothetical protein